VNKTRLITDDFDAWLTGLQVPWTPQQIAIVRRAYALGTPRGLAVADTLAELHVDHEVMTVALLYAALSEGKISLQFVKDNYGVIIARLVDGVTRLDIIGDFHRQGGNAQAQLENLRRMLLAMAQDIRVVLIKLVIRLNEMHTLSALPTGEQKRIAQETLDVFTPLANRLGMGQLKWELEDLSLRYLEPETYQRLTQVLDERRADRERYIATVVDKLKTELQKVNIQAEVFGRAKHIYSIWRKMQRKQLPFEQIFDIRAVRVLVPTKADCYAALGIVHALWNHIREEFDDYIAKPKPNGYQSLHTAVIGPGGKTLEVQIRTQEMHQSAELGVAAHWLYKEAGAGRSGHPPQQIAWLRQMLEWKEEITNADDFLDRFKSEALQDRVYVVTPKGAIMELSQGATPLDFAYHIHTEVGHCCRGARVNGHIVPLTYELKNGELVDIITAKNGAPSRDWLSPHLGYLKTSRAQAKVRQWFKQQDQEKNTAAGRTALEREFQRLDIDLRQVNLQQLAEKLNFTKPDELYAAIGHGDITTGQVAAKIQGLVLPPPPETLRIVRRPRTESGKGEIRIRGVGNLLTQIGHCCSPVPFEPIIGYITRGRGVTIHRQDCANLLELANRHRERLIEVEWGEEEATYPVDIQIDAYDRPGLLRDITSVLVNEKVNVLASTTRTDPQTSMARMMLTLEITDLEQLSRILDRIAQLPNIASVGRRGNGLAKPREQMLRLSAKIS
jgi:GTP pyrophosphokinase